MTDLVSAENLQLFLMFVVPGIVFTYFRCQFLTGRLPPFSEGVASYVIISLVYQAVTLGLLPRNDEEPVFANLVSYQWGVLVFVAPAALGIISGLNARHGWTAQITSKARASTVHPIACAWDWKFSHCSESWVRVNLKNGTVWAGVLGTSSFLSSNPSERDLFLEKVYSLDGDDVWKEKASSVWISHGEVQSIEMWPKS